MSKTDKLLNNETKGELNKDKEIVKENSNENLRDSSYEKDSKKHDSDGQINKLHDLINSKDEEEQDPERLIRGSSVTTSGQTERSRTFLNRYFSPIKPGSLRSSIFNLSNVSLGMGTLALPVVLSKVSFVMGMFLIFFSAMIGYYSLNILVKTTILMKCDTYSESVKKTFGPGISKILDVTIIIYQFGTLIAYVIVSLSVFELFDTGYLTVAEFEKDFWNAPLYSYIITYSLIILILPLCLLKDISKMSLANIFSIISLIYVVLVIIFECPFYYRNFKKDHPDDSINWFDITKGFNSDLDFFKGTATFFFAFACHAAAIPVYKTLENNKLERIQKVYRRSIMFDYGIYLIASITGFLTEPINTHAIIIYRDTVPQGTQDFAMTIARLGMAIGLILSIPCNYNALRLSMLELCFKTNQVSTKLNLILTIPTITMIALIAINFKEIEAYISILGGFCVVIISFLFPILIYVKNNEYPMKNWKNISSIILLIVIVTIGFTAGTKTIVEMF